MKYFIVALLMLISISLADEIKAIKVQKIHIGDGKIIENGVNLYRQLNLDRGETCSRVGLRFFVLLYCF